MEPKESSDLTVPVLSEEISAGTRQVATGQVRVTKKNLPHEELIQQELRKEHVDVKRVQVNKQVEGPQQVRQEGDVLIVPVVEEVLQVQKIWILKEELHVRRSSTSEMHEERVVVNREEAIVERVDEAGTATSETPAVEKITPAAHPVSARREVTSLLQPKGPAQRRGRGTRSILTKYSGDRDSEV